MKRKRYTNGYMVYGCDACGNGFKMYLEESLEDDKYQPRKPVPFTIQCPFCKKIECRDVSGVVKTSRQRLRRVPAFWNVKGEDCGKPMNMELAQPEYRKRPQLESVAIQNSFGPEALEQAAKALKDLATIPPPDLSLKIDGFHPFENEGMPTP